MPNEQKKFRILRGSGNKPSQQAQAEAQAANDAAPANADTQQSRVEQAARARMAEHANARSMNQRPEQEILDEVVTPEPDRPPLSPRDEINQIKAENLTGRQLRIARRLAQKHGLKPTSDLDAVRLLRKQGIDPFNRGDVLNSGNTDAGAVPGPAGQQLPAKMPVGQIQPAQAPQPQIIDDDTREQEIRQIQLQLTRRRRARLATLLVKLAFFVLLPGIIAGYYYYRVATPMYATYSEFIIESAEAPGARVPSGGLTSPLARATDSIAVQGYLTSRDAMLRLDENPGFRTHYQAAGIDVFQRLDPNATNEETYDIYTKKVIIGFDPTEGVIKMEVIAPSADLSLQLSEALIGYAEEQVDQMSDRLRSDQMRGAQLNYEEAELAMELALDRVAELQRQLETFDPSAAFGQLMNQISVLETQILEKELELAQLEDNPRPNRTKLRVLKREIEILNIKLSEKRNLVTAGSNDQNSIVDVNAELTKAQTNLELRQELFASSAEALEAARIEADRQTRYLLQSVSPVVPDDPAYPRAFENTLLSFIIFGGIYLMIALTVSILREQVST